MYNFRQTMRSSCLQLQYSKFRKKCNFEKVHVLFPFALKAIINYFILLTQEFAKIIDFDTIFPFLEPCYDDAMLVVLKGL